MIRDVIAEAARCDKVKATIRRVLDPGGADLVILEGERRAIYGPGAGPMHKVLEAAFREQLVRQGLAEEPIDEETLRCLLCGGMSDPVRDWREVRHAPDCPWLLAKEYAVTVWAVVYGNYDPPEVLALYDNEDAARDHADAQDGAGDTPSLEVVPMTIRSVYRPPEEAP